MRLILSFSSSALNLKFEQLNGVLKQLSTTTDDSPQHKRALDRAILKRHNVGAEFKKQTNDDPKLMRMALEEHYELVRIGSSINETFGTQALLSITFMFLFLVALLWYVSTTILWSDLDKSDVRWVLTSLSWVAFGGYKIFNMTSACAKATNEVSFSTTLRYKVRLVIRLYIIKTRLNFMGANLHPRKLRAARFSKFLFLI